MMKILTGLFALILVAGLLVACQNPSAAPSTPAEPPATEEPTTTPDPDADAEPMVTDLDLTWGGWDRAGTATSGSFMWSATLEGSQEDAGGVADDLKVNFTFTKDARGVQILLQSAADTPATLCALDDGVPTVSGRTISFSYVLAAECDDVFTDFDSRATKDDTAANGPQEDDKIEVELTLSELPDLTPMPKADAKEQEISFSGTVTITHKKPATDLTPLTADATGMFDFTGTAKYDTPEIQPASN